MRSGDKLTSNLDWPLLITYFLLLAMGIVTVYSVAYNPENPNLFSYSEKYGKQIAWLCIAMFLGFLVFLIDSQIYRKFALLIYLITVAMLVVVLFMPPINGARAWLGFGNLGIQPAEFAKIGTAILLARYISEINVKVQTVRSASVQLAVARNSPTGRGPNGADTFAAGCRYFCGLYLLFVCNVPRRNYL